MPGHDRRLRHWRDPAPSSLGAVSAVSAIRAIRSAFLKRACAPARTGRETPPTEWMLRFRHPLAMAARLGVRRPRGSSTARLLKHARTIRLRKPRSGPRVVTSPKPCRHGREVDSARLRYVPAIGHTALLTARAFCCGNSPARCVTLEKPSHGVGGGQGPNGEPVPQTVPALRFRPPGGPAEAQEALKAFAAVLHPPA